MIATIILIYFAAAHGFQITSWLLLATVIIDITAWSAVNTSDEPLFLLKMTRRE